MVLTPRHEHTMDSSIAGRSTRGPASIDAIGTTLDASRNRGSTEHTWGRNKSEWIVP